MEYGVYAIRNTLDETYDGLFLFRTELSAQVNITQKIPPERKEFNTIYRVGRFNIETGILTPLVDPIRVDYYTPSDPEIQTPIDHGSPDEQQARFVERTSDVRRRR